MGYLLAAMAAILWATLGILGKFLYGYNADPLTVVTIRASIAFITLVVILAVANRRLLQIRRRDIPFFAVYGLVGVSCNYAFYFYALNLTSVTTAVILLYIYPALVAVLATLLLKERLDWIKRVVLVMTFVGCLAVVQGYDLTALKLNLKGVMFGLGAGLAAAIYSLFGKMALQRYDSWTTVCYAFGFGALFLLVLRPPQVILSTDYAWQAWIAILALAWFPTLLAYTLFMTSMKYIEASKASITATLEPVVASLLAYIFLGEMLEWPQVVGVGLVLAGIIALKFSPQPV